MNFPVSHPVKSALFILTYLTLGENLQYCIYLASLNLLISMISKGGLKEGMKEEEKEKREGCGKEE